MVHHIRQRVAALGLVARFTFIGATAGLIVASGLAWYIDGRLTDLMLAQVAARAIDQAELGVLSATTAADFAPPFTPARLTSLAERLDPLLSRVRAGGSDVIRLHVFARDGTVLYSDLPSKRGQVVPPDALPLLAGALAGAVGTKVSTLSSAENADLRARYGNALEVYVPFEHGGQIVGAYEIYQDMAPLAPVRPLVWGTVLAGVTLLFLALLVVVRGAAASLHEQQERFRAVAETANDAIVSADAAGQIVYLNARAEQMFGRTETEVLGHPLTELIPTCTLRAGGTVGQPVELVGVRGGGDAFPLELSLASWETRAGRFFTAITRDLTGRKQAEQALRQSEERYLQAQKMEAIGLLAGGIAHDFNNLLTVITGYSDLALSQTPADDRRRPFLQEIARASQRAAGLTGQLLAFSRQQMLQPQMLDVNAVVADLRTLLRPLLGEDIELVTRLAPDLPPVLADPGQLGQVIVNLAANARDAMPRGGKLLIDTTTVEVDETPASDLLPPGRYAMIAVSDTGIGMDRDTQGRIFEPFFTTKGPGKGTGLGLSTVYGIVKQSGGDVRVYSEPGRGTTFRVYLPCREGAASEPAAASPPPARGSETVLLVEDEEAVRRLASSVLTASGYQVLQARHAEEALALSGQHPGPIHLLLTDLVMPGMSGRELAEQVTELRPESTVLYMSGYTDDVAVGHGLLTSSVAYLNKPFTPAALAHKVREVLDGASEAGGRRRSH